LKSIGARLMVGFSLVILLVCLGLGYIVSIYAGNYLHQAAVDELIKNAENAEIIIRKDIEANLGIMAAIASRNAINGMEWEQQLPALIMEARRLNFKSLGVAASDGVLKLSDGSSQLIDQQGYFVRAWMGETGFCPSTNDTVNQSSQLIFSVPIEREGQIVGVLVGIKDLASLSHIINEMGNSEEGNFIISTREGTILAHPNADRLYKNYSELEGINDLKISGARKYIEYTRDDGDKMILGYAPIENTDWMVAASALEKKLLAGLSVLNRSILISSFFAILLGILFAFQFGRKISLPINMITTYYRRMAEGDFSHRLDSTWTGRKDELGALALGYNTINFNIGRIVEQLAASEFNLRQITDNMTDVIIQVGRKGTIIYISPSLFTVTGWQPEELLEARVFDLVHPDDVQNAMEEFQEGIKTGTARMAEFRFPVKSGAYKWFEGTGKALYDDEGRAVGAIISCREIEERKKAEKEIEYLVNYDVLTKLYNRRFFEQRITELDVEGIVPVAILVCDVDGLKLINDTLGHTVGDQLLLQSARLLLNHFSDDGAMVARIGGDEFAVLLPGYGEEKFIKVLDSFRSSIKGINEELVEIPFSISVGYAIRSLPQEKMMETFKRADEAMYREKLLHSRSNRSAIVEVVMKALEARDYLTEGHGDRMQNIVTALGEAVGMHEHEINDLRLFARFHDLGKVGVPDQILFKEGKLTVEEYEEMKKHSEIGYRIAQTSPDFHQIADWILKHHEWWDGNGYPLGLKAGEIPLQCRMLAIADAFDAMMNDRPYRQAKTLEETIAELRRCAGTQFDPILIEHFLTILQEQDFYNDEY
jgi:diguanylate cyclase (GGDEF)-like protein/PAS domain S-box-containing protein